MEDLKNAIIAALQYNANNESKQGKNVVGAALQEFLTTEYDKENREHTAVVFTAINTLVLM